MSDKPKVLVADDRRPIRSVIKREFAKLDYEVIEAEDGVAALKCLVEVPNICLMTLDMEMPNLGGLDVLRKLQDEEYKTLTQKVSNDNVKIILVTSNDTRRDRDAAFGLGATDFVVKPFEEGELAELAIQILQPKQRFQELTVLVADDSDSLRKIITSGLDQLGVKVIEVSDGADAYKLVKKDPSKIDIILTDLHMNTMNGDELCKLIHQDHALKHIPVIVLSSITDSDQILHLFKQGASDYLYKPFLKEEFKSRIAAHLRRTQLEKRLGGTIDELKTLNEFKDSLISICSHDLRAPLNGVLGFTDLLLEDEDIRENKHIEMLTQIKQSGRYLLELINDILDLGKIESNQDMEFKTESINVIIQSCIATLLYTAKPKNITLNFVKKHNRDYFVNGNYNALARILNNLLSNAIKFTPLGGSVTVITNSIDTDHVVISVRDTGIGIPKDQIPKLFDKFTSASQKGTAGEESTGLGLSITKSLVSKHDGKISVQSSEGKGAEFAINLPLINDSADHNLTKGNHPESNKNTEDVPAGLKILLADDNNMNLSLESRILEKLGCTVKCTHDGLEAVEEFQQNHATDNYDMIFLDIEMPLVNGVEAARRIRALENQFTKRGSKQRLIPIVAMTGNTQEKAHSEYRSAGMNDVITKPVNKADIQKILITYCT